MGEKRKVATECFICERPKPSPSVGFIKCNHCGIIFFPECSKEFESFDWFSGKDIPIRCPKCKNIGFSICYDKL